jgi:hypothetical protein
VLTRVYTRKVLTHACSYSSDLDGTQLFQCASALRSVSMPYMVLSAPSIAYACTRFKLLKLVLYCVLHLLLLQETLLETEVHMLLTQEMNSSGVTNGTDKQQQGAFKVLLDNRRVNVDLAFKALMEQAVVIRSALLNKLTLLTIYN